MSNTIRFLTPEGRDAVERADHRALCAFGEGEALARKGGYLSDNPHPYETERWQAWREGFFLVLRHCGRCDNCGGPVCYPHDHRADQSGLDDGPYLPGCAPRRKRQADASTVSAERRRAWETRRAKYGARGHR